MILVLAMGSQLLSSCGVPYQWNADIKSFMDDGRSILKVNGFTAEVGGSEWTVIPSGKKAVVTLDITNPRSLELTCVVQCADESLFDSPPVTTVAGPNSVVVAFTPALCAERKDLVFTVSLSSPEIDHAFTPETVNIRCNTPPTRPESLGAAFDGEGFAFTAFKLPSSATDDDLKQVKIVYKVTGTEGVGETAAFTVNEACLCGKRTPLSGTDLLGVWDPLNRYFRPETARYGNDYDFKVVLIDTEGLESETSEITSGASGVSATIPINPPYGMITLSSSTVSVARGTPLTVKSSLAGAVDYRWYLDNALQTGQTAETFTWVTTPTTQPGQYIINVDAKYKEHACTGSILVTVTW